MFNLLLSIFRPPKPTPEDLWREAFKAHIAERTHIFGDELDDVAAAEMESWLEDEDYLQYDPAFAADESLSYWGD